MAAASIALAVRVPSAYLSKILRRMVAAGLLRADRGRRGGFRLAKPAHRIRFVEVFDALGERVDSGRCIFGRGLCSAGNPCPLHGRWAAIQNSLHGWASRSIFPVRRGGRR